MGGPGLSRSRFAPPAGSGSGGSGITVDESGVPIVVGATTLDFIGLTVTPGPPGTAVITLPGGSAYTVEYHAVTAGEMGTKSFIMGGTPSDASEVVTDIIGGASQEFGVDFDITGNVFDWNGLGLDGIIAETDVVRLAYFS